jgi:hypothetical protein
VILSNDTQTSEYSQSFTYGNSLSYYVTLASTPNPQAPIDTAFSFTLFDGNFNPVSNPNSPSGQAFTINIDGTTGNQTLATYFPPPPILVGQVIPEPSSVVLLGVGVGVVAGWGRWRGRRGRCAA